MSLFLTKVLLGWTGIGWIGCVMWSVSDHVRPKAELSVDGQFISKILHGGIATLVENSRMVKQLTFFSGDECIEGPGYWTRLRRQIWLKSTIPIDPFRRHC